MKITEVQFQPQNYSAALSCVTGSFWDSMRGPFLTLRSILRPPLPIHAPPSPLSRPSHLVSSSTEPINVIGHEIRPPFPPPLLLYLCPPHLLPRVFRAGAGGGGSAHPLPLSAIDLAPAVHQPSSVCETQASLFLPPDMAQPLLPNKRLLQSCLLPLAIARPLLFYSIYLILEKCNAFL